MSEVFCGAGYSAVRDKARLTTQLERVEDAMRGGDWRAITDLCDTLRARYPDARFPENSVQAQLRNLRKKGHTVERRHIRNGLFEYRLADVKPDGAANNA